MKLGMMNNLLKTILLFFSLFLMVSCQNEKSNDVTYFGGKIINPKEDRVILFYQEKPIDTLFLDDNNKFMGSFAKMEEGLYHFMHGIEHQYIYLEPKDSLMLRLNTWDFDESLVFAGKGAERNNMLIDCFLAYEKEKNFFYEAYTKQPKGFKNKVDSLLETKIKTYNEFVTNYPEETKGYKEILKIALTYPAYARIERYPIAHVRSHKKDIFPEIDSTFYAFRSNISHNKSDLMYYPPYSNYVRNFLYNKTYALGHKPMHDNYSPKFTNDLLSTIHGNISCEVTRNAFLKQTVISHFYNKSSCDINKETFETYLSLTSNNDDKNLINNLLSDTKSVHKNKSINNFVVKDYNDASRRIKDIIKNKNTLLFFWNPEYVSESYITSRIDFLTKEYPNIQFVEIKIDGKSKSHIRNIDIKNQFYLDSNSTAHAFLSSKLPRSILVDKNGRVINGYASISSKNVQPYLASLQK
jgi:hypothetical protein